MKAWFKRAASVYLAVAFVYGIWALVLLQFRECGFFGRGCAPVFLTNLVTVVISAFRGISWLPEMAIAILRGEFLDWLFLRNSYAPPVSQLVQMILHTVGGR